MRPGGAIVAGIFLVLLPAAASAATALSDAEVRRRIIAESIAAYPGPCPCPYNLKRNGKACGTASAHSKPGGRTPVCYEREVTAAMVSEWRARAGR